MRGERATWSRQWVVLAALWAEVYGVPADAVRPAAEHRARAMDYSDRGVAEGPEPESPLLDRVRDALIACYRALGAALAADTTRE